MDLKGNANILSKLKRMIKLKLIKIAMKILIPIIIIIIATTAITREARQKATTALQTNIYKQLEIEDLSELVEIKGNENSGYYLEFVEDIDDKLEKVLKEDKEKFKAADIRDISTLKKFIKAQLVTEYPNLGSSVGSSVAGGILVWPTDSTEITSPFGYRHAPTAGASSNHGGIDIGVETGTNVYACQAGTVTTAEYSESAGNWVVIDHGEGYVSKYMHNDQLNVSVGQTVTQGQVIAKSGNTGISTGAHLHFQIDKDGVAVDPLSFKYTNGKGSGTSGFGKVEETDNLEENDKDKEEKEKAKKEKENKFQGAIRIRRVTPNKNVGEYKDTTGGDMNPKNEGMTEEGLGSKEDVPERIKKKMLGVTIPEDAEDYFKNLSYLTIPYVDFNGKVKEGHMIVNKSLADEVLQIFQELYNIKYPIESMKLLCEYEQESKNADKDVEYTAVDDNNTYSFYYMGSETNSTGNAIELNPQINPKVKNGETVHANAKKYKERKDTVKWELREKESFIDKETNAYKIFEKYGWTWKGEDDNPNYGHFEKTTITDSSTEETTINSRVYDLKYVPEKKFEEYIEKNDYRALQVFTLDKDKKLTTATWSYQSGEGMKITKGKTIDYKAALSKYNMPYEYLVAMAMHTEDKVFCEGLADLAINSEYIIAVQDSVTTTQVTTQTDVVKTKNHVDDGYISTLDSSSNTVVDVSESASQSIEVTYVDCWYIKFSRDYSYSTEYLQSVATSSNAVNLSGKKGELIGNFKITAYCNCAKCCGQYSPESGGSGKTASGTMPKAGLTIAADPSVLPMGSYVSFNEHIYHVEDTGGAIKGNRIDLYMNSHQEALNWGVKNLDVYWAEDVGEENDDNEKNDTEEGAVVRNVTPISVTIDAMGKVSKSSSSSSTSNSVSTAADDNGYYTTTTTTTTVNSGTISYQYNTGNYKISGNSEAFVKLYKSKKCKKVRNIYVPWLIESLEQNSKTAAMCDITEYLFAQASGKQYGTSTLVFDEYKPGDFNSMYSSSGGIPLYAPILSKEDFVRALQEFSQSGAMGHKSAFDRNFLPHAEEIYDVSVESNVNPELVIVTALTEQGFKAGGGAYNYWGIAVYNGSDSGSSFSSLADGIRGYAKVINSYGPDGKYAAEITKRYEERKAAGCDPLGYGMPGTFSGMQSIYSSLGKHEYGSSGAGGYYYMDPDRAGVTTIYATHQEFLDKCKNAGGEHAAGTPVTVWENGQYTAYQVQEKIDVWNKIFGKYGTLSAGGDFLETAKKVWMEVCTSGKFTKYGGSSIPCRGPTIDCSAFVSWVLYEYGYTEFAGGQTNTEGFKNTNWNQKYGWEEIAVGSGENPYDILQPGDIFVRHGNGTHHVTLVVEKKDGKIYSYDCGNTSAKWNGTDGSPFDETYFLTKVGAGKIIRVTPVK